MMVIFLVGLVSMILMRTLRKDYARYSKEEDGDDMVTFLFVFVGIVVTFCHSISVPLWIVLLISHSLSFVVSITITRLHVTSLFYGENSLRCETAVCSG